MIARVEEFDAFDLPDWIGIEDVTWHAESALSATPHVRGVLASASAEQQFDLLAVDAAFPQVVCPADQRRLVHRSWEHGQVDLVRIEGRVAAAAPATRFDPNIACEAIRRVAKAVGSTPARFTVILTL